MNLCKVFSIILKREFLIAWRKPFLWLNPLLFYVLVCLLFPLTLVPDVNQLKMVAPGIIWMSTLLAFLWSLNHLFQTDYEDGSMEQWLNNSTPFSIFILGKMIAHCCLQGLPVLLITPFLAAMFHLSLLVTGVLIATLVLGLPLLTLLGSIGAGLTIGLPQGGLLMAVVALPLYIPTLIFATSALSAAQNGFSAVPSLLWLAVLLPVTLMFAPLVTAGALRLGMGYR